MLLRCSPIIFTVALGLSTWLLTGCEESRPDPPRKISRPTPAPPSTPTPAPKTPKTPTPPSRPADPFLALHLTLDDNAATSAVLDRVKRHTFALHDPTGDAHTDAHTTAGVVGAALAFDGKDDWLDLTGDWAIELFGQDRNFTIAFWARFGPATKDAQYAFHLNNQTVDSSVLVRRQFRSDQILFYIKTAGTDSRASVRWSDYADWTWEHYALAREGDVFRVHRNGRLSKRAAANEHRENLFPAPAAGQKDQIILGASARGNRGRCAVDDFRVYNRALSEAEIQELYEKNSRPKSQF